MRDFEGEQKQDEAACVRDHKHDSIRAQSGGVVFQKNQ